MTVGAAEAISVPVGGGCWRCWCWRANSRVIFFGVASLLVHVLTHALCAMCLCLPPSTSSATPTHHQQVVDAASSNADVFIKLNTPTAGTHVLTVQPGEIVEIVIQNDR